MTDKKETRDISADVLMADTMLRLTAMEKLLLDKGIFTKEELTKMTDEIAQKVAHVILEKAQAAKNMEGFIADLEQSARADKIIKN